MENRELMGIGWPLGLGSMHMRLRLVETTLSVAAVAPDPRSLYIPSTSFSSLSSSNLDTESTASFFQDNSKTLGRLIGLRPKNRKSERYLRNSMDRLSEPGSLYSRRFSEHPNEFCHKNNASDMEMCDGICFPLCLLAKTNNNKHGSKR